jgi:hypothetical protein
MTVIIPDANDDIGLTPEQIDDFAEVLSTLGSQHIKWFARSIVGDDAVRRAANLINEPKAFARAMLESFAAAGRMAEAVAAFRRDAPPKSRFGMSLMHILRGGRLSDKDGLQALTNTFEPFFNSKEFMSLFPRISRTVCAIGLAAAPPNNGLRGSGFLVGPDLVMTSFHVLEPFLTIEGETIRETESGDAIFCFFDYMSEPAPRVPHQKERGGAFTCATAVPKNWLVHAREWLPRDGCLDAPADAGKRYDYAIIRLSERLGKRAARKGGGPTRGWLKLPDEIDLINPMKRLILYQHPQKSPQQIDVGDYIERDPSNTRVRYRLNAARGSSGGAAVDMQGQLFALHTAAVVADAAQPEKKMNQGVRIDLIAADLKERVPGWTVEGAPNDHPIWSLTDELSDPHPIIGRDLFRDGLESTEAGVDQRAMVIWGPPGCGLQFSVKMLRRILGVATTVVEFSSDELSTYAPDDFLSVLISVEALGVSDAVVPVPKPNPEEDLPRWIRALATWLRDRLQATATNDPGRYPAWIVLHTSAPTGRRFKWGRDRLVDLVAAIAGAYDPGQPVIDIPQLRFLFLASSPDSIPNGFPRWEEDLTAYGAAPEEFADCLRRAWRSVDKDEEPGTDEVLAYLAEQAIAGKASTEQRKALSEIVKKLVIRRLSREGE